MADSSSHGFTSTRIAFILAVAALVTIGTLISFDIVQFNDDLQKRAVDLLTNLGVLVLVLERALEIFIIAWRNKGRIPLENDLRVSEESVSLESEHYKKSRGEKTKEALDAATKQRTDANEALFDYKDQTKIISQRFGIVIGIIISIAGFRVLDTLFISDSLTGLQLHIYDAIDILLTAGVLAGGSKGIHTLSKTLGDFFETTSANLKSRNVKPQ